MHFLIMFMILGTYFGFRFLWEFIIYGFENKYFQNIYRYITQSKLNVK